MSFEELNIQRKLNGEIPDEAKEIAWRDARDILENAGPQAGFVLLTVHSLDEEDKYETRFATSSGYDRITGDILTSLLWDWLALTYSEGT